MEIQESHSAVPNGVSMSGEIAAARSHPVVIVSVVVAALAVTACALVAIAWMLGWVPSRAAVTTPASVASPGQQVAGTVHDIHLLPGETLVTSPPPPKAATPKAGPEAAAPATPQYAKIPEPAPRKPAASTPSYAQAMPSRAAPSPPGYPRAEAPITSFERSSRSLCINCGTVASITGYSGDQWDVRVRFEDGSAETLRYRTRPPLRIGQRVRLEEGRLVLE
jgi:hypothetical protein